MSAVEQSGDFLKWKSKFQFLGKILFSQPPVNKGHTGWRNERRWPILTKLYLMSTPISIMNGHTNGSSGAASPVRIYDARSVTFPRPTPQAEDYASIRGTDTAIVIDNGIYLKHPDVVLTAFRFQSAPRWMGYRDITTTCYWEPSCAIQRKKGAKDILSSRKRCFGGPGG